MSLTAAGLALVLIVTFCGITKAQTSFPSTYAPVGFTYAFVGGRTFFGGGTSFVNFGIIGRIMGFGLYGDALFDSSEIKCSLGPESLLRRIR